MKRAQPRVTPAASIPAWVAPALGALAVAAAYSSVRHAGFLWDDDAHVTANPVIIGPLGLKEIWTSAKANYFPLTMTSFWVQHALWGLSPGPYHVVSVLGHVAAVMLLGLVLRRLRVPGAWLGAVLWGLHPVQVESVAWISELKNTQSGVFYLLSIWLFVRWLQGEAAGRWSRDYVLAIVAALLAILSKSSTVMLPVVLGLIGWWLDRRRWREAIWLTPFLAVSLLASAWTIWEQKVNSMAAGAEWSHGLAARFVLAGKVPWFYLGKLAWPEPLVFIYPRWDVSRIAAADWIPFVAVVAVGGVLWRFRHDRARPLALALGYFVISLFPVLGFFDVFFFRYSFVGDHFQYLASMGPLALAGAGIVTLGAGAPAVRLASRAAAVTLVLVLGWLSAAQTRIYQTNLALWRDTVARNPAAWIARVNLGAELAAAGKPAAAISQYAEALRLKPQFVEVELNWGNALILLQRPAEALPHFKRALRGKWGIEHAHAGIGLALYLLGRTAEARSQFEDALRLKPELDSAHFHLGNCLLQLQRPAEAVAHFETACRLQPLATNYRSALAGALQVAGRPDDAVAQYRNLAAANPGDYAAQSALAELLSQRGLHAEAIERGRTAVRLRPDSAEAHFGLGNALLRAGRPAEAVPEYEGVLRLKPDDLAARSNLAGALYGLQRPAEAAAQYALVVQAQPGSPDAHNNLGSALMQAGRLDEALVQFETAVRLRPDDPGARNNFALGLATAGRVADAITQCREALRRQPDFKPAQEQLRHLEQRSGQASP